MSENDWTTTSVKLSRDMKLKLEKYCEMEKTTPNKLLRQLIEKELAFMTDSSLLREKKGLPLIGEHLFSYDPQKDGFNWVISLDGGERSIISEEMTVEFTESLLKSLKGVIETRKKFIEDFGITGEKTVIPNDFMRFEVKK
jgi:predicted DNA-binding protein